MHITLDRKLIESLKRMSDEGLWRLLCGLFSRVEFNRKNLDPKKIRQFRALLHAADDDDIAMLNRLMDVCRSIK